MNETRWIMVMLAASTLALGGCSEDADSEDIHTSGLYAGMDVKASASNRVDIETFLLVGGSNSNTYVNLTSGDTLTASLNDGTPVTLSKHTQDVGGEIYYRATFTDAGAGDAGAKYTIAFNRPNETSAPNSSVTLPAPVAGFSGDKSSFSRGTENITFTWTPLGNNESLDLAWSGPCIINDSKTVIDNGASMIGAGSLADLTGGSCSITFSLIRKVTGTRDPAYGEGGYITGWQTTSTTANSTP